MDEGARNPPEPRRLKAAAESSDAENPIPEIDGRTLMEAVRRDEPGAFERLVSRYQSRVRASVTRILGSRSFAEDLAQEAFLRVYRARHRYQPTARFETWLHRIVLNLCLNHAQSQKRRQTLPLGLMGRDDDSPLAEPADPRAPAPLMELERGERAQLLRRALGMLPETQRQAVLMARFEGLSQAEIADVLGITTQAVKSLLWRARDNLRRRLAPILGEDHE